MEDFHHNTSSLNLIIICKIIFLGFISTLPLKKKVRFLNCIIANSLLEKLKLSVGDFGRNYHFKVSSRTKILERTNKQKSSFKPFLPIKGNGSDSAAHSIGTQPVGDDFRDGQAHLLKLPSPE